MFTTPPNTSRHVEATVRTRRAYKKELNLRNITRDAQSEVLKTENIPNITLPERPVTDMASGIAGKNRASVKSFKSKSSMEARRKMLEYEAAKAKAEIEAETARRESETKKKLIEQKLAADLAALETRSISQRSSNRQQSEVNSLDKVNEWLERSNVSIVNYDNQQNIDSGGEIKQLVSAIHQANDQNVQLMSRIATSKDLPQFYGDPLEWLAFKQAYDESTQFCKYSDAENMWRLRKSLRGEAKETVSALLIGSTSPNTIIEALALRYGRPETIINKITQQLRKISPLSSDYHHEIVSFSIKIKNYVAAVQTVKQTDYLRSPELVTVILSKLPSTLLTKWADYYNTARNAQLAKLEVLAEFLYNEANKITTAGLTYIHNQTDNRKRHDDRRQHAVLLSDTDNGPINCKFCRVSKHKLTDCGRFKRAMTKDRWRFVRARNLCHKCLLSSHNRDTCSAAACGVNDCVLPHHRLLHWKHKSITTSKTHESDNDLPVKDNKMPSDSLVNSETVTHTYNNQKSCVLLKVVPIRVHGAQGIFSTHALLDDGATVSLISADFANRVNLKGHKQTLCIRGAWNSELTCESESVNCKIENINNNKIFELSAKIISELNLPVQTFINVDLKKYKHLTQFCDISSFRVDVKPKILIGQDNYHLIAPIKSIISNKNEPCATLTPLGWCIHGVCHERRNSITSECAMITVERLTRHTCINAATTTEPLAVAHTSACGTTSDSSQRTLTNATQLECDCLHRSSSQAIHTDPENDERLHDLVRKSFMFENIGVHNKPRENEDELKAIEKIENSAKLIEGMWEVGLPWKEENTKMTDSFCNAYRRLKTIERKMTTDKEYANRYSERVHHLFTNCYARRIDPREDKEMNHRIWYLPHFGVDNPNKKKLRLVFDAAASSAGQSLNDYLLPGPNLLESLLGIMLRFRERPVGLTGDIKDMFLRIRIRARDQHALRFLWRDSPDEAIKKYAMTSLIFGANCSPFIAQHIKNKNANRFMKQMPEAVNAIVKSHFMDDYIDCFDNCSPAIKSMKEVTYIHQKGGFEIRNWTSNDPRVCQSMPTASLSATAVQFKVDEDQKGERTLGLIWYPNTDLFGFNLNMPHIPAKLISCETKPTKRELLRIVMSIFDVYGLLAPFTIKAKILMQSLWKINLNWDEQIKSTQFDVFCDWITQLKEIKELRVPRWYFRSLTPNVQDDWTTARASETLQLHVFCDASPAAYAAVAYWHAHIDTQARVSFIACKSRVAPIKAVTMPRLELQAAVLACRLAATIQSEHTLKPIKRYFWSDSTTVLHWIRNKSRSYNVFVANRLGEIDELSDTNEWHYVSTDKNIADVATKNNSYKLQQDCEWFRGPKFLYENTDSWFTSPPEKENIELNDKNLEIINHICVTSRNELPVPDPNRFSSWLRLLRCTATVLLFVEKCKRTCNVKINTELLNKAEVLLLRHSQMESFSIEIHSYNKNIQANSRLRMLTPYFDELGLLRVGGRVEAATDVTFEVKRPVIMDGRHPIARLITKYYHEKFCHGNNETIVNELRQKYWLLNLRPTVRSVAAKCYYCRIRRSMPFTPRMADLPEARLAHNTRPFTHCGVDLFGPMEVTVGRRREKRYGVLFTCMTIRAVHIELVPSLTADSFIMALRRMASRRGWPHYMYSDNGTNLRGADKELKQSYQDLHKTEINNEVVNRGVIWSFNSPISPHKGGAWERLIRSVKTALRVILKERAPREETLATLLAEIENIVNSRPLTHVSAEPDHLEALTPNHFLIGSTSNLPVPGAFDDSDLYLRKMWRIAQRLADMFWQRWVKEVLPTLIPRQKWYQEDKNLKPGDVVIVVDPNLPRNTWLKGVVENVYPGRDGRVRTAKIKTKTGSLTRPVTRLALLPTSD